MIRNSIVLYSTAILLVAGLFIGCSDSATGPEEKPVDQALVVGTQVPNNFLDTGEFDLLGTPLDNEGQSMLSGTGDAEYLHLYRGQLRGNRSYQ